MIWKLYSGQSEPVGDGTEVPEDVWVEEPNDVLGSLVVVVIVLVLLAVKVEEVDVDCAVLSSERVGVELVPIVAIGEG